MFLRSVRDRRLCTECGFCKTVAACPSPSDCIGCLACFRGCPSQAMRAVVDKNPRKMISLSVDGVTIQVPERTTLKAALEYTGVTFCKHPEDEGLFAPCENGGCYSCCVLVDGETCRSCVTPVVNGMTVRTEIPETVTPLRIVHGPEPHPVGGKGTPWWIKSGDRYVEVAIWVAGCCYSCPQCQNYHVTYDGRSTPSTPSDAAKTVTRARQIYQVKRMAISGGEPTLNRRWLVDYFKELKRLNPADARLHLDSNGAVLTKDYIDELILDAGVTDIGIEPKAVRLETFMRITGVSDRTLAERYLRSSWTAVDYVIDNYRDRVFLGIGLPYNRAFIDLDEVYLFGRRVAEKDPEVQVCVLDYFAAFRRGDIKRPLPSEMLKVKKTLEEAGCKTTVVQTSIGHIGPRD